MSTGTYVAGVIVAMSSSMCSAVGLMIQKRVHLQLDKEKVDPKLRKYYMNPKWILGVFFMLVGAIASFAVFALLGQARASAFAALTIVWNGILAYCFLSEKYTIVDFFSTIFILVGAGMAVYFGSSGASAGDANIDTITADFAKPAVWQASIAFIVFYILAALFIHVYCSKKEKAGTRTEALKYTEVFLRAFLAGLFSGPTGMLAKDFVQSISGAIKQNSSAFLSNFRVYLFIIFLPVSLVFQLGYLNSALKQMDALTVVPIYQVSIVLIGIAFGWIFGAESAGMSTLFLALFLVGAFLTCIGVILLLFKRRMMENKCLRSVNTCLGSKVAVCEKGSHNLAVKLHCVCCMEQPDDGEPLKEETEIVEASDLEAIAVSSDFKEEEVEAVDESEDKLGDMSSSFSKLATRKSSRSVDSYPSVPSIPPARSRSVSSRPVLTRSLSISARAMSSRSLITGETKDHHSEHLDQPISIDPSFHFLSSLSHIVVNEAPASISSLSKKMSSRMFSARNRIGKFSSQGSDPADDEEVGSRSPVASLNPPIRIDVAHPAESETKSEKSETKSVQSPKSPSVII
jgi:MFS family permease